MAASHNTLTNMAHKKEQKQAKHHFWCSGFFFSFDCFGYIIPRQVNSILGILHLNCIIKRVVSDASAPYHYDLCNQNNDKVSNQEDIVIQ